MNLPRRRFLSIAAAACAASPAAAETVWRGSALGARAEIRLAADRQQARPALQAALDAITRVDRAFSLFRPGSELRQLNADGTLLMSPTFSALVARIDGLHAATDGLFDPTVGTLWNALLGDAPGPVGWEKVEVSGSRIHLRKGMALTFNAIAQGFVTDRVAAALRAHGFDDVVVDIGEVWVGARDGTIGMPDGNRVTLRNRALSTSIPSALTVGGHPHILSPKGGRAQWASATVGADDATTADAVSTALVLAAGEGLARHLIETDVIKTAWLR